MPYSSRQQRPHSTEFSDGICRSMGSNQTEKRSVWWTFQIDKNMCCTCFFSLTVAIKIAMLAQNTNWPSGNENDSICLVWTESQIADSMFCYSICYQIYAVEWKQYFFLFLVFKRWNIYIIVSLSMLSRITTSFEYVLHVYMHVGCFWFYALYVYSFWHDVWPHVCMKWKMECNEMTCRARHQN